MSLQAGFAEIEITPPVGKRIIGWIREVVSEEILDPLFARVAVLQSGRQRMAFVQMDTLSVRWTTTNRIRKMVQKRYGFPGKKVMVSATHNHAGPAVANAGMVRRDDEYVDALVEKIAACFGQALDRLQAAEIGFGSCLEFDVGYNRRVVMRDGRVKTHGNFNNPDSLCFESPIDPEVGVIALRKNSGKVMGTIVNFTCHPTHHGSAGKITAGFPGVLAHTMKARGCPVTLFLNGAAGNIHTRNPVTGEDKSMQEAGTRLAEDVTRILDDMELAIKVRLGKR